MDNYLDKLKHIDDRSIRALLKVLEYQIRILGTNVIIESYDEEGEHRQAFGALFQTDDFQKTKKTSKPSRFVINRNYLTDHYAKTTQPLQIYTNKDELTLGDLVVFTQDNINYRFKVEKKDSHGLSPHVLYKYDLIGLPEDKRNSLNSGSSDGSGVC